MAKINKLIKLFQKSPTFRVGLFFLILQLCGCQSPKSPEEVTSAFWTAFSKGDIETAKRYGTDNSQDQITKEDIQKAIAFKTGRIVINGDNASVETFMTENSRTATFNTDLVKENNRWKVDLQKTRLNMSAMPLDGIFKSLEKLGENFNKQLERQIPLFEKQIENLGEELNRKLDEFGHYLEDPKKYRQHNDRGI